MHDAQGTNICPSLAIYRHRKIFEICNKSVKSERPRRGEEDNLRYYEIKSILSNILFDGDGKVVDVNLRGEQLDAKLAEIFLE